MNKDTIELLKECDAGTKTAVNSIKEVLDNVQSEELMTLLQESLQEHQQIGDELHTILDSEGESGKEPNPMARAMSWLKINFKMLEKPDDKTIANLMFDGCSMGVKQLSEYLNEYTAAEDKAKLLAKRLINEEEKLGKKLKIYL